MTDAITTHGLTKAYGRRLAVRDLSITIPRGVIAGFVGPNGAGKTTTIRMLLGLVRPTSGSAEVLGLPIAHPPAYLPRVGALIESPAFYPSLSGRANLLTLCSLGGIDRRRVPDLLRVVGLGGREGDRVSGYSMGMKQRLGVAAALLKDPDLLILDEPANGLDPPGIIEIRELMRRLRDDGKTIFVSSHLLAEVEQVADWLVVLKEGEAIYSGPIAGVAGAHTGGLVLAPERSDQVEALSALVAALGFPVTSRNGRVQVSAPPSAAADINERSMQAGIRLVEMRPVEATLEEKFLAMIRGES